MSIELSLAIKTDLLVEGARSQIIYEDDIAVVRTPDLPNYYYGNFLVFDEAPTAEMFQTNIERFHAAFKQDPEVKHVTLQWVHDTAPSPEVMALAKQLGYSYSQDAVLVSPQPKAHRDMFHSYELRVIQTDQDWELVTQSQIEIGSETYKQPSFPDFMRSKMLIRRDLVDQGKGIWVAAFDQDTCIGDMGIYATDGIARYQSVGTKKSYRGQGIAGQLIAFAANEINHPVETYVIIAEAESTAHRLYAKCGFDLKEHCHSFCKYPDE